VQANALRANVRAAAQTPDPKQALDAVRSLVQAARRASASRASRTQRAVTPQATPAVVKPGTREERLATHIPARGLSARVRALLEGLPETFDEVLTAVNSKFVRVDPSCMNDLEALYRGNPELRQIMAVRLNELDSASAPQGSQWSVIPGTEGQLIEGTIGVRHKIMVRRTNGNFLEAPPWTIISLRKISSKPTLRAVTPPPMPKAGN
jgi:hypothetical protein